MHLWLNRAVKAIRGQVPLFRACIVCKLTKPADGFFKYAYTTNQGKRSQRLDSTCKACCAIERADRHAANRDAENARSKAWREANPHTFGLAMQVAEKHCSRCKMMKPASQFYRHKGHRDGLRFECKDCHKASVRDYQQRNPGKKAKHQRKCDLKAYYGLTPEAWQAMLSAQDGRCAVCREAPKRGLCVDHCHRTRKVRALLCSRCNTALGQVGESIDLLRKLADYLTVHS